MIAQDFEFTRDFRIEQYPGVLSIEENFLWIKRLARARRLVENPGSSTRTKVSPLCFSNSRFELVSVAPLLHNTVHAT